MKNKKNRKNLKQPSPGLRSLTLTTPDIIKFKFNLSRDNISCFMSKNRVSKHLVRKNSQTQHQSIKPSSKPKSAQSKKINHQNITQLEHKKDQSPDIIRELSNTILSKIQEKGISYTWNENQDLSDNKQQLFSTQEDSLWTAFEKTSIPTPQKSFASTNDHPYYHTVNLAWNASQPQLMYINQNPCSFIVQSQFIQNDWRTTLMVRNIPNKYTVNELAEQINSQHANTYDFLYLPCDPKNNCNVGYGFINFIDTKSLLSFYLKFNRYTWQKYKSEKVRQILQQICALTYARLQGLDQLIEHFENSKVLNQKEKKYRPIIKLDKIHQIVMEQQRR